MPFYAIYDNKDYCVCVGTSYECCNYLKVSYDSFYSYVSRNKKNHSENRKYSVYKFED